MYVPGWIAVCEEKEVHLALLASSASSGPGRSGAAAAVPALFFVVVHSRILGTLGGLLLGLLALHKTVLITKAELKITKRRDFALTLYYESKMKYGIFLLIWFFYKIGIIRLKKH